MAPSATIALSPTTATPGELVTVTLSFVNDGAALTIAGITNLIPAGTADFFEQLQTLVGQVMAANATTVVNFGSRFFSGNVEDIVIAVKFSMTMSDGSVVTPAAQNLTVTITAPTDGPPPPQTFPLPGSFYPTDFT